jgi:hypothetical protein
MQRVNLDGVDLEYDVQGSGEPLLLIYGSIVADAFFPPACRAPHHQRSSRDLRSPPRLCWQCPRPRSFHDGAASRRLPRPAPPPRYPTRARR